MDTPGCCNMMVSQLGYECSVHPSLTDCPDVVVVRSPTGQIRMPIRDGGSSFFEASFCPWCGTSLNSSVGADQRQWSSDSEVLAQIGRRLFEKEPTSTVLIPTDLANAAVAAWERNDTHEQPLRRSPRDEEDRQDAAALALIGLAITERGKAKPGHVSVEVSAWQIGTALDAADRRNLLL